MNARTDVAAATSTATALPTRTRLDLLETIASVFERHGEKTFKAIPDLEGRHSDRSIKEISSDGNMMQVFVETLNAANVPTAPTLGAVMDNLGLDKDAIHVIACLCEGDDVPGVEVARRVRDVARSV